MLIEIKSTKGNVLFSGDFNTIGEAVTAAVKTRISLRSADLQRANLQYANLQGANLQYADLRSADLRSSDLQYANLQYADLRSANLQDADLRSSNLRSANLQDADLRSADLQYADLQDVKDTQRTILCDGDIVGYKKLSNGSIAKLLISAQARRVGGYVGRKCRAEYALVVYGSGVSAHNPGTKYEPGLTVIPDSFDPNPYVECSHGIHFFITEQEAKDYN